jgi:hypothetical protein
VQREFLIVDPNSFSPNYAPAYFTKGQRAIPMEIELLLLCMVLFELVGGDALD